MPRNTAPPQTRVALFAMLLLALGCITADAKAFQFEKIVDTSTPIPGGVGNFTSFRSVISDSGNVWFIGSGVDVPQPRPNITLRQNGIYRVPHNSSPIAVVDKFQSATFNRNGIAFLDLAGGFSSLSVDQGDDFAFGYAPFIRAGSVFSVIDGSLEQIPGTNSYVVKIDNEVVVFPNGTLFGPLFKSFQGTLTELVSRDGNTPIPEGTGTFATTHQYAIDGHDLVFHGDNLKSFFPFITPLPPPVTPQEGLYKLIDNTMSKVADLNTPIPNGNEFFTDFGGVSIDNQRVLFSGSGPSDQAGLYLQESDGSLNVIVAQQTAIPDSTDIFTDFLGVLEEDLIVFWGIGSDITGLYLWQNNALSKIIDTNDTLDGKSIVGLGFFDEGLDNFSIAFTASFTDGSQGVFSTTIPEPTTLSILAVGYLLALQRRRSPTTSPHLLPA